MEPNNYSQNIKQYQNTNDLSVIPGNNISEQVEENESFLLIEERFKMRRSSSAPRNSDEKP